MGIDINKVKARLAALSSTNNKSNNLWKPKVGESIVRIIPYKHNPENPFIELLFHFGLNNKTYLSPATFGKPDPIIKFADKLKDTGDKEDWKAGKNLEPKMRVYAALLVRGEEDEGPKFWGFGKQVYETLLKVISDADYGDITDFKNGRDIVVEFKAAQKGGAGKSFPETIVRCKPNITVATEDKNVIALIKNQPDILTLFPEPTYEELEAALEAHINPAKSEEGSNSETVNTNDVTVADAGEELSASAEKSNQNKATSTKTEDVDKTFEELLNS